MKRLPLILCLCLLASCATIKINADPNSVIQGVGYTAAYMVLQNNPDLIPEVEQAVSRAVIMADSPTVDVAALMRDIQGYAADLQVKRPRDAKIIYPVIYQLRMIAVDVAVPAEAQKVLPQIKALLKGIGDGVRDAKGVVS